MSTLFDIEPAIIVDRSTLEDFSRCPRAAAWRLSRGVPVSREMASGVEVHEAISALIREYVADCNWTPAEMVDRLRLLLRSSRVDLQPDIVRGCDPAAWAVANHISRLHPGDILRFDGGAGERSGQVSRDVRLGEQTYRVTSEVDLLTSTESPDVLAEIDWKSGWTPWSESDVAEAFQFQLHWWILSEVYPTAQALDMTVWDTRRNRRTYRVRFTRAMLETIGPRVMQALGEFADGREAQQPAAYPLAERCGTCEFNIDCFDASPTVGSGTPESMVDWLVVAEAATSLAKGMLNRAAAARGSDIVSPLGNAYGTGKPRKAMAGLYNQSAHADASGDDE